MALTLPCAPSASAAVRAELSQLDGFGWILGDVMLVASELVNNAVIHSGCMPHHELEVRASRCDGQLTLSVRDPGLSESRAGPVPPADRKVGGWGLQIVEALCERWGEERDDGYRVWAEISAPTGPLLSLLPFPLSRILCPLYFTSPPPPRWSPRDRRSRGNVVDPHGQPFLPGVSGWPPGHRPGSQHPIHLESEVVVQGARRVLLDDESGPTAAHRSSLPPPMAAGGS